MQDLLARARSELRHEPIERRVRADDVVDSTRAILVWEPRRVVPSYAVPTEDIAAELAPAPAADREHPGVLHPGVPFAVWLAVVPRLQPLFGEWEDRWWPTPMETAERAEVPAFVPGLAAE